MKKLFSMALALLLVASTFALTACTEKPPTSSSKTENSQSVALPSPTPSPSPIPTELTDKEKQRLYDEYMAEEHIWEKNLDADDGYLVVPDDNSNKIIKVRDDETNKVVKISDFTLNSRVDTHDVDDFVYAIIDEHKIIRCDRNFENKVEIYSTTDNLYMLEADRETLYFTKNDVLCRLHLASGIVDELVALPRKIGSIMPHSNYEVEYSIQTQDYTDYLANGDFSVPYPSYISPYENYIYDSRTKTNKEYVVEWDYTTGPKD